MFADRRSAWLGLGLLAVGTAGVMVYLFWARDRGLAGTVIQAVAAVMTLAITAAAWLLRKQRTPASVEATGKHHRAVEALAVAIQAQWEEAARDRRLLYPAPVSVRWRWSKLPVSPDHSHGSVAAAECPLWGSNTRSER